MPMPGYTIVSLAQAAPAAADQPAAAPTTTTTMAAPDAGTAPDSGTQTRDPGWLGFMPMILIFVVMYLLLIRPQQKRQKEQRELVSRLKAGDRVLTNGGIFGTITSVKDTSVMVEIAKGIEIEVVRVAISSVTDKPTKA